MDAHAQLRAQLNVIHGELAARGIHSPKIDNATYSIETLTRAYMAPDVRNDWEGYGLTKKERDFADLLFDRLGRTVRRESFFQLLYFDRVATPEDKIIDVFVCHLRRKGFGPEAKGPFKILTDWGVGYKMVRRDIPKHVAPALAELAA